MDYDDLLRTLGEFGPYQRVMFLLVCLLSIPSALNNLSINFMAAEPPHWCLVPSADHLNLTLAQTLDLTIPKVKDDEGEPSHDTCMQYDRNYTYWNRSRALAALNDSNANVDKVNCRQGWTYDNSTYSSTIVTEWDLVCSRGYLLPTASSVYMAGLLFGVVVFSAISDWFGRRAATIPAFLLMFIFSTALTWSPNYVTFVTLRFLTAGASLGLFTTIFVTGIEMVGPSWRAFAGVFTNYFWVAGNLLIGGAAYGLRDWRHLALALALPQLLFLPMIFIIPESPRWLYSRNKHERADAIVRKMAKFNKVDLPDKIDVELKVGARAYVWDLFRFPRLRWRTLNICFNWFVNSMVYYGLTLNTGRLGGSDYVNFVSSLLVEVPATIFCQLGLRYLGRRPCVTSTMVTGGAFLLLIVAVPNHTGPLHTLRVAFAMLGKMCISASFTTIYIFSAELFPTVVRSVGVSSGSMCARIGGIVAPYILTLGFNVPNICFGVLSIVAGVLALLLPETRNQQLPESITDGENFPSHTVQVPDLDQPSYSSTEPTDTPPGLDIGITNPACLFESNI